MLVNIKIFFKEIDVSNALCLHSVIANVFLFH